MSHLRTNQDTRFDCMPVTIGSIFRQIVKDLKTKDTNPNSCLNNPKSDFYNPNYDINNPNSTINNQYSCINDASNNENNKELRRNALRELIKMYLSDYLSEQKAGVVAHRGKRGPIRAEPGGNELSEWFLHTEQYLENRM